MATLTKGENFVTNTSVTGARLNNHVDGATISNVAQADMAASTGTIVRSASAPSDTDAGWWDTANNVLRIHNGSAWLPVATGALLTNKSGGQVVAGDVIVADTANDNSFKTSTTLGDSSVLGVAAETIAADASGVILYGGIQDVLITGTVNRGEYLKHSTTAKKATSTTTKASGSFGIALETGTDTLIQVLITGTVVSLSAGTAETVTADWIFSGNPDFSGAPTFSGTFWASQANMEAASSNVLAVTPGRLQYHPGVAKAWISYGGATPATIVAHNVDSSITDTGTGDSTISFTTDFSAATFVAVGTVREDPGVRKAGVQFQTKAAGTLRVLVLEAFATLVDVTDINVVAFGDQ